MTRFYKFVKIVAVSTVYLHLMPCTYKADGFSVWPNEWAYSLWKWAK